MTDKPKLEAKLNEKHALCTQNNRNHIYFLGFDSDDIDDRFIIVIVFTVIGIKNHYPLHCASTCKNKLLGSFLKSSHNQ